MGNYTGEIWKDIEDYEGLYQVSNYGRVKSLKKGALIMKPQTSKDGYKKINLRRDNKTFSFKTHRLVAKAFILNPDNLPEVNHIDGNKINNHVSNLEWITHAKNMIHAAENKLAKGANGIKNYGAKLTDSQVLEIRTLKGTMYPKEICAIYGIKQSTICKILQGKLWKHLL
jgi:hypothetical protein